MAEKKYIARIEYDYECPNPREDDNYLSTEMYAWSRRYDSPDANPYDSVSGWICDVLDSDFTRDELMSCAAKVKAYFLDYDETDEEDVSEWTAYEIASALAYNEDDRLILDWVEENDTARYIKHVWDNEGRDYWVQVRRDRLEELRQVTYETVADFMHDAEEEANADIQTYTAWADGFCYDVTICEADEDGYARDELDICGGFILDLSGMWSTQFERWIECMGYNPDECEIREAYA